MPTLDGSNKPSTCTIVPGAAAVTDIAVPGIPSDASLIMVHHITANLVTNVDVTSEASITDNGIIRLTTTTTTGDFVAVTWQMPA